MLTEENLHVFERAGAGGDTPVHLMVTNLCQEVWRLRHELADPRYLYSGRIPRSAIICRNEEIDQLKAEIKKLKTRIAELEKPCSIAAASSACSTTAR